MIQKHLLLCAIATLPTVALAQDNRELDAHEHGVTSAEIALEGETLAIDLTSPGMDIVGFEYAADSAEDKDAVAEAIRQFSRPDEIVTLPEAAGCRLSEVLAHLHAGEHEHDETDSHAEGDHDHAEGEAHAEHEDHDHAEEGAQHSAFHVHYEFSCDSPDALARIDFPFFDRFENAREIEARYVTQSGAGTSEIARDAASLAFE